MKKLLLLGCLLLLVTLLATGCKAPEPADDTPTATPTPVPTPTYVAPTPEPLITPRPMDGVIEMPEAGATLLMIDPIDKPTRPPIGFGDTIGFVEETDQTIGIKFEVPDYWRAVDQPSGGETNTLAYEEPIDDIRSGTGVQSQIVIHMEVRTSTQTKADAESYIDTIVTGLSESGMYTDVDTSSKADNQMMGQTGRYVTYRANYTPEGSDTPIPMRGRILVVPVDRKLYMVRYICPADFVNDYIEVFYQLRRTLAEI